MMNGSNRPPAAVMQEPVLPRPDWIQYLEDEEWRAFSEIILSADAAGVELLIGGALGLSAYMPLRRRTKDIDFYVLPQDRERILAVLAEHGFEDFYDQLPYDRSWIYRSIRRGVIIDIIWSFANQRAVVDDVWFRHSRAIPCGEAVLRIVPPEELIRAKLFVLQRDRCDWPDLFNLLYYAGPALDWDRLIARLGPDRPLLDALVAVYSWLCPGRPAGPPLSNQTPGELSPCGEIRADLLDSRPWFLPMSNPETGS